MAGPGGADAVLNYRTTISGEEGVTVGFHRIADSIDDADDSARRSAKGMDTLSQSLARAQTDAALLRREFAETGDVRILKEIGKADREVKRLSGWMSALGDDTDHTSNKLGLFTRSVEGGVAGLARMGAVIPGVSAGMGPYVIAVGGATAAITGMAVAAAAGGIAVAGLGAGVLAWGAKIQSGNAEVTDSINELGQTWEDVSNDASRAVGRALVPALGQLQGQVRALEPDLTALFNGPAKAIPSLTQGIIGLTNQAMPGLQHASEASGRVLTDLSRELPNLGATFGQLFDDIADGSEGGTMALLDLVHVIEIGVNSIGKLVKGAEMWYEKLGSLPGAGAVVRGLIGNLAQADEQTRKAERSAVAHRAALEAEANAAKDAANWMSSLTSALGLLNGQAIASAHAQLASMAATSGFSAAIKESRGSLDDRTAAGRRAHTEALSAIETYGRQADAIYRETGSVEKSTAAFYRSVESLRSQTTAGSAARRQIDSLIAGFVASQPAALSSANSVKAINIQIAALKSKVVEATAHGNYGEVARLNAEIARLRSKTVFVTAVVRRTSGVSEVVNYGANPLGGQQRAAGGEVAKGKLYEVGEAGREYFMPSENGSIVTEAQKARMGTGGGGGVTNYITVNTGADPAAVVAALQRYAQDNNGVRLRGGVRAV